MKTFWNTLRLGSPMLYLFGWIFVGLLCGFSLLYSLTDTQILGVNAWVKPIKFAIATTIFTWTMAWMLYFVKNSWQKTWTERIIAWVMVIEIVCIALQAARGTTSHFNIDGWFNFAIFQIMGSAITANTVFMVILAVFIQKPENSTFTQVQRLGVLWGIWVMVIGSLEGFAMGAILKHTVGNVDGGPGIPFLNWSKIAGDLRVAHFVGIHALQVIPLATFLLIEKLPLSIQKTAVHGFGIVYFGFVAYLYIQAMLGIPLF